MLESRKYPQFQVAIDNICVMSEIGTRLLGYLSGGK